MYFTKLKLRKVSKFVVRHLFMDTFSAKKHKKLGDRQSLASQPMLVGGAHMPSIPLLPESDGTYMYIKFPSFNT